MTQSSVEGEGGSHGNGLIFSNCSIFGVALGAERNAGNLVQMDQGLDFLVIAVGKARSSHETQWSHSNHLHFSLGDSYYVHSLFLSSGRFHSVQDRPREIVGGAVATHIPSPRFTIIQVSSRRLILEEFLTLLL